MFQNLDSLGQLRLSLDAEVASVQPLDDVEATTPGDVVLPAQRGFRLSALRPVGFGTAGM